MASEDGGPDGDQPKILFSTDRRGAGHLYSLDGRSGECAIQLDAVTARDLVNLRCVTRKTNFEVLKIQSGNDLVATLFDEEVEAYLTGLIAGKADKISRFYLWELSPLEGQRLAPTLEYIRALSLHETAADASQFLALVTHLFEDIRFAHFATQSLDGDFTVLETSKRLRDANTGWFASAKGANLTSFPDRAYADWSIESYGKTVIVDKPTMHQISIDLHMGTARRYRQDYIRLSLPFRDPVTRLMHVLTFMTDLHMPDRNKRSEGS